MVSGGDVERNDPVEAAGLSIHVCYRAAPTQPIESQMI
jgi:hypothetical protein